MDELMTIGEFATVTWLSPKALRLYDHNGLLSPDAVDPFNGYRKYSRSQIEDARLIMMLRRIDMPLEQIGELLELSAAERSTFVALYRQADEAQHARRRSLGRFLEHAVTVEGSLEGADQPDSSRFEVSLRTVAARAVLTSTQHTSARELPEVIRSSATRLFQLADERGGAVGESVVIYHGQVGWESDGPVEVCVPIRDPTRAHRMEPEHTQLFTRVLSEDVQFPGILGAFDAVRSRARKLDLTPAGPPREIYMQEAPDSMPRCEVALPVTADDHGPADPTEGPHR
ncbi:MAG: MerR family transcriptional regulator [Brachybacterium sp.]|nr:MerR family transcriptional regulator [Brachybacterium sp.]